MRLPRNPKPPGFLTLLFASGRKRSLQTFLLFAGLGASDSLIVLAASTLTTDPIVAGSLVSIYSVIPLLVSIPAGTVVRFIGENLVVRASLGLLAVGGLTAGLAFSLPSLYLAQTCFGAAQVLFVIVALPSSARSQRMGGEERAEERAVGAFTFLTGSGRLIGPVAGGMAAQLWGFDRLYLMIGLMGLVGFLLELARSPHDSKTVPQRIEGALYLPVIRNRSVHVAMAISAMTVIMSSLRSTLFPLYAQQVGLGPAAVGQFFSLQSGASLLTRPFLSSICVRFGRRNVLRTGTILIAVAGGVVPFVGSYGLLAATSLVYGIGFGLVQPLALVLLLAGTEGYLQHLAMSVWLTSNRVVMLISPLALSALWVRSGVTTPFLLVAGIFAIGACLAFNIWKSTIQRPTSTFVTGREQ